MKCPFSNKGKTFPIQVLNETEIHEVLAAAGNSQTGVRNRAVMTVMLRAQLRCAEATGLKVEDFDETDCSITVLRGKGGKRRVVGIDRSSAGVVKQWIERRPAGSDYLFCTLAGGRMSTSYVRAMMRRIRHRTGLKKRFHPHGLRHTGASRLVDKGVDIRIIQRQLGHSNLLVTDRYVNHINPRAVIDSIRALSY